MFLLSVFPRLLSVVIYVSLVYLYQNVKHQVNNGLCEYLAERNTAIPTLNQQLLNCHLGCKIWQPCTGCLSFPHLSLTTPYSVTVNKLLVNNQHVPVTDTYIFDSNSGHLHFPGHTTTIHAKNDNSTTLTYSRSQLLELNKKGRISKQSFDTAKSLGILRHVRGRRGGRHIKRRIGVVGGNHPRTLRAKGHTDTRPSTLVRIPLIDTKTVDSTSVQKPVLPTIFLTNAQSLGNKFEEVEILFDHHKVDIGVITESWFSPNMPEEQLNITGYNLFYKCRDKKKGGGVAVYVRDEVPAYAIDVPVPEELECTWVNVRPRRLPRGISSIAICAVYIVRDSPFQDLLRSHLLQSVDYLRTKYPEIGFVILGDFNRMNIQRIVNGNDLNQIIYFPTRGNATLDLVLTNHKLKSHYRKPIPLSPIGYSDHLSILWEPCVVKSLKNQKEVRITRPFRESGVRAFGQWVQNQDWLEILQTDGTQEKTDKFYQMLDLAIDDCFPLVKTKSYSNDKPWLTDRIKNLIIERQAAFSSNNLVLWRKLRNQVKREIKNAKVSYHANRIRSLQKTEPKKWHQQIKAVTNSNKTKLILDVPGIDDSDAKGKANAINTKFAHVSDGLPPLNYSNLPAYLPAEKPPQLHPWEVFAELRKLKSAKAAGPDQIPPRLVKEFAYELSVPLTNILNSSYLEGKVPSQWKQAIVVPIPKQHPPSIDKLRPVSLTSIFAKIAEGFVTGWVLDDVEHKIDTRQFGNVKGVSTSHYLVSLVHHLYEGAERSYNVGRVVLTDFSKAFDLVDHTTLINKIICLGVRGAIIPWICDFLHGRQQCVRLNNTFSDYVSLNGGVPQGTKIGPIGFQILINDAAQNVSSGCWKYVDDLTFAENTRGPHYSSSLQAELDDFVEWSNENKLKLNPSKCQALQVCFSKTKPQISDLRIGTEPLSYVTEAKVLGVFLQDNLKWDTQVNNMLKKANKRLFMLRSLKKFGFDRDELCVVYCGYVRPILEYADAVWHPSISVKQGNDIESIQKRACRTILGGDFRSYNDALVSCGLDSLSDRRVEHCRRFAEGLPNNDRTRCLIPPSRLESHGRNLRNCHKISILPAKTKRFQCSPIPYYVGLLNQ